MQLFEMQGLLAGKCLPGDMFVGESLSEYFLRQFNQRDELARQVSALQLSHDDNINSLGIKGDGPVSKLVIEYVMGLVAENVALKDSREVLASNALETCNVVYSAGYRNTALRDGLMESTGDRNRYPSPIRDLVSEATRPMETLTTDAAIAEIESVGAEKMLNLVEPAVRNFCNPVTTGFIIEELESLAANLRAGRKG